MAQKLDLTPILESMDEQQRADFMARFSNKKKNRTTAFLLAFFLGSFGAGRFYVGNIGTGVAKLILLGGFGIWWLVDLFLIGGMTDKMNFKIATGIADSMGITPGLPGEDTGGLKTEGGPTAAGSVPVATAGAAAAHASGGQQVTTSVQANYTLAGVLSIIAVVLLIVVLVVQWQEWSFYLDAWPRSLFR